MAPAASWSCRTRFTESRAQPAGEWQVCRFDDVDLAPGCTRRGGDLQTDEATADDDDPGARTQSPTQGQGVWQRPQVVDVAFGWQLREMTRAHARGDHEVAPGRPRAVCQHDFVRVEVDTGRALAQPQRDVLLPEVIRAAQQNPLGWPLAREDLLGQRGPVVGRLQLLADERDPARPPGGPRGEGRGGPRGRGSDDDQVLVVGHHHVTCRLSGPRSRTCSCQSGSAWTGVKSGSRSTTARTAMSISARASC